MLPRTGGVVVSPRGHRYLLGQLLGEGAFGLVFDAVGPFDQAYAVKVFLPAHRPYAAVRDQWLREAGRLLLLRHPNIVYVHDSFEAAGLFYLLLERCDHTLEQMIGTPFTDRLVVDISRQLLFALQYLADSGIVHNDLHAGNVMVVQTDRPTVKLSDFGIAQELYGQRAVRPTLVHHRIMAPEVVAGGYSTTQSDLYQLGLLVYAMHTGLYPIDFGAGYDDVVAQIRAGVPRSRAEALGTPIGNIASVLLRRHEQYRYTSPAQVWEDLRRLDVWGPTDPPPRRTPVHPPPATVPPPPARARGGSPTS
ncbi:MAG: serine/threonine protein kinase [Polyangiaceae bacterium]|nr:serine/threonine protein kinase [Polyangiaceae bacterium]